jgi:hypothetical protein
MPRIQSVETGTHDGKQGFIIEWEFIGFHESTAKSRAVGQTSLRFPTTIVTSEVVGVREYGNKDYNVQVFVPTEGFMSAGITNPVEWMRENLGDRFIG